MTGVARIGAWGCVAAIVLGASASAQEPLIADLSSREIAITTGFTGASLLLFGAIAGSGDVVVVVRGPARREVVRRKKRVAGVWMNAESVSFPDVPVFYRVATARPLADIAPEAVLDARELGADRLRVRRAGAEWPGEDPYRTALLRNKGRDRLYSDGQGSIKVIDKRLFRTDVFFPANVPTGTYAVEVMLFRGGHLVDVQRTPLAVRKVGLEADIFNFAHEQSALYGIIAILIALMAGWLAGVVFRKS